jgi:hypothetical protein
MITFILGVAAGVLLTFVGITLWVVFGWGNPFGKY